jgi:hypothetical protein
MSSKSFLNRPNTAACLPAASLIAYHNLVRDPIKMTLISQSAVIHRRANSSLIYPAHGADTDMQTVLLVYIIISIIIMQYCYQYTDVAVEDMPSVPTGWLK